LKLALPTAPPLDKYEETFTLSALLASLTLFPVSILIGVSGTVSILFTETFELTNVTSQAYLKLLKRNAYLVIFGAFVGSAVFPLDWDRPWQIYPIPNFAGAITGQLFGCFFCLIESMIKSKLAKKQR
jgi:GPI ethanolamine phosphate transferase 2/3 subunit F